VDSKVESSSPHLIVERFPKRVPSDKDNYIEFFKLYFEKLSKEHRKWTATQISSVIRLMWKKRKNQMKTKRIQKKEKEGRTKRIISGRRYFRR